MKSSIFKYLFATVFVGLCGVLYQTIVRKSSTDRLVQNLNYQNQSQDQESEKQILNRLAKAEKMARAEASDLQIPVSYQQYDKPVGHVGLKKPTKESVAHSDPNAVSSSIDRSSSPYFAQVPVGNNDYDQQYGANQYYDQSPGYPSQNYSSNDFGYPSQDYSSRSDSPHQGSNSAGSSNVASQQPVSQSTYLEPVKDEVQKEKNKYKSDLFRRMRSAYGDRYLQDDADVENNDQSQKPAEDAKKATSNAVVEAAKTAGAVLTGLKTLYDVINYFKTLPWVKSLKHAVANQANKLWGFIASGFAALFKNFFGSKEEPKVEPKNDSSVEDLPDDVNVDLENRKFNTDIEVGFDAPSDSREIRQYDNYPLPDPVMPKVRDSNQTAQPHHANASSSAGLGQTPPPSVGLLTRTRSILPENIQQSNLPHSQNVAQEVHKVSTTTSTLPTAKAVQASVKVLGLDGKVLSKSDIEKAFRSWALKHHTDKGGNQAKFQEIVNARDILLQKVEQKVQTPGMIGAPSEPLQLTDFERVVNPGRPLSLPHQPNGNPFLAKQAKNIFGTVQPVVKQLGVEKRVAAAGLITMAGLANKIKWLRRGINLLAYGAIMPAVALTQAQNAQIAADQLGFDRAVGPLFVQQRSLQLPGLAPSAPTPVTFLPQSAQAAQNLFKPVATGRIMP